VVAVSAALAVSAAAAGAQAPIRLALSAARSELNTTDTQTIDVSGRTPDKRKLLVGISSRPCLADAYKEVNTRPGMPLVNRVVSGHFRRRFRVKHPGAGVHHVCAYLLHTDRVGTRTKIVTDAHTTITYTTK
jgi:hypothetical protein